MLKQSLIFIPKPVLYFRIEDIFSVELYRINAANKQFDLKVTLRDQKKAVEFMGIERGELENLVEYFSKRQVKVIMQQEAIAKRMAELEQDQSEDQDFEADEESESESDQEAEGELGSEESSSKQKQKKRKEKSGKDAKGSKASKGGKEEKDPNAE